MLDRLNSPRLLTRICHGTKKEGRYSPKAQISRGNDVFVSLAKNL
jgi:hypothetical protein